MDNVDTMENLNSVGSILKEARVKKGLSLIDAEKATTIRCAYLDALEQDEYYKLPEEVFIKGMIRNYGNFLGLNGPELVDLYKAEKAGTAIEKVKSKGIREVDNVKLNISLKQHRSAGSGTNAYQGPSSNKQAIAKQIFAGLLGVVILVGGYFGIPKAMELLNSKNEGKPSVVIEVASPEASKANAEATNKQAAQLAPVVENVVVEMTAHGKCWLEVNADGVSVFEGMLSAQDTKTFEAKDKLIVKYGNVGVMEVKVNGQPVSMQGEQGVALKTYTR
jgi:cytoskeletal protein RodZ